MTDGGRPKLGAVCAFIEEQPSHSTYNVRTLLQSLGRIKDMQTLTISNGCAVSEDLRRFLNSQPRNMFLELSMNIGVPAAWNLGIDLLDCDYVFFLNDDIRIDAHCIDEILQVFTSFPDTAVAGVEGVCSDGVGDNGFPRTGTKYKKKKRAFFRKKEIIDVTNVSGFLFAVSGAFLKDTSFRFDSAFSPAFCEELDLAFFARSRGYKTRIVHGLNRHYDHSWGVSSGPREIRYLGKTIRSDELTERNIKYFCEKWHGRMTELLLP